MTYKNYENMLDDFYLKTENFQIYLMELCEKTSEEKKQFLEIAIKSIGFFLEEVTYLGWVSASLDERMTDEIDEKPTYLMSEESRIKFLKDTLIDLDKLRTERTFTKPEKLL